MNGHSESMNTLNSCLADLQLNEDKSEMISPSCENNNTKEDVKNGISDPVHINLLSNTKENSENTGTETKGTKIIQNCSVTSHTVDPNFARFSEPIDTPVLSSATSTKSIKITESLEDLSRTVDKILESGGGVKESLRSSELSYLGVTPELSEMMLQHGEFPATPTVAPIPCTWNTPPFATEEKSRGIYLDFRSTYPFTGRSMKIAADLSSSLSNHSSAKSLPSIVSFDSGEGEGAWSSVSPSSSSWMSAASNYGSEITKAPRYVTPPSYSTGPIQPHHWNPNLNEKFYWFKDCKSSSYQEMHDHSDIPPVYGSRAQLNILNDMNTKREIRHPSRNARFPNSGNQTYPGTDGEKKRNFKAETFMMKTVDTLQRAEREYLRQVPLKTSINDPRMAEALSFTKAYQGMPDSSTPLPQAIKSPNTSVPFNFTESRTFPVMEVSRILPGKNLLHDVIAEESSMAIQAHPLFPLLRFLASAEIYYETASRFITTLSELLPSSTSDLISTFLRSKPDNAYIYRTSTNITTEYVIRDAITFAHRCLQAKIMNEATKNLSTAEEVLMKTEVDKVCLKYLDAVRSSTPSPPQQSLSVDSTSALNGNPLKNLDQMLEAFSPIPPSINAAGVSPASEATPSKYTKAVEVVTKWLREHEDNPYPDDDQKSMLMSQTGLSSKEVTEIFSSRTDA